MHSRLSRGKNFTTESRLKGNKKTKPRRSRYSVAGRSQLLYNSLTVRRSRLPEVNEFLFEIVSVPRDSSELRHSVKTRALHAPRVS